MTTDAAPADWTRGEPILLVSQCETCGYQWYLPRDGCPRCGGARVARLRSGGSGVVTASTTVHRAASGVAGGSTPFGIALVDLAEGVRVMGRCPPGLPIGAAVRVVFVPAAGDPGSLVPCFEVAGS